MTIANLIHLSSVRYRNHRIGFAPNRVTPVTPVPAAMASKPTDETGGASGALQLQLSHHSLRQLVGLIFLTEKVGYEGSDHNPKAGN